MANIVPFIRRVEKIAEKTIVKISLTSIACKVSEKIVKDRVVNYSPWTCSTRTNSVSLKENQF